jgi:putative membrane protein
MKIQLILGGLAVSMALSGLTLPAAAEAAPAGKQMSATSTGISTADSNFVKEAAEGGLAEVEMGKLAVEKASNPEVRKFGQRMIDDHTQANERLKNVASSQGITPPDTLNAKDESTKQRLESLSGTQFDRAYMTDMVKDHSQDVAEFEKESSGGSDAAVKSFAAQTLPTLQGHLKSAKEIEPQVMNENN